MDYKLFDPIQAHHRDWMNWNFAPVNPLTQALGVAEEIGELSRLIIDRDADSAKYRDAMGDICIFALGVATTNNLKLSAILNYHMNLRKTIFDVDEETSTMYIPASLSKIAHGVLKNHQKIRGNEMVHKQEIAEGIAELFFSLERVCCDTGLNLYEIVRETWEEVSTRNWKNDPINGKPEA